MAFGSASQLGVTLFEDRVPYYRYSQMRNLLLTVSTVMQALNKGLNKLRRAVGITDRGSKYLLFSNRSNLNFEQIQRLAATLKKSECLRIA